MYNLCHLFNAALHVSPSFVALEPFGDVLDVSRDTWRIPGLEGVETTTRLVRLTLKDGVTLDQLPHQLRLDGGTALVVVPGRPPLCLRCKRTGHVRKDCRVPRCEDCRRFGHITSECVRTYATITNVVSGDDVITEHQMDEVEAENAASGATRGPVILPNPSQDGEQTGVTASAPAGEHLEDAPVDVVEVPVPVIPEVADALTEKAPPGDGDEARSSTVPSRATKVKDVTRRSRSRTKGKKTSKSPRRHSDSSSSRKSSDTLLSDDDASTGSALGFQSGGTKKRRFHRPHRIAKDDRRKPTD